MKLINLKGTLLETTLIKIVNSNLDALFIGRFKDIFDNDNFMYSTIHIMWLTTYKNENQLVLELEN